MKNKGRIDYFLLFIVLTLVAVGLISLLTAGVPSGYRYHNDPYVYVKAQLNWVALGLILLFLSSHLNYHRYTKIGKLSLVLVFLLLIAVYFPRIGREIRGVRRWIILGSMQIQASELAKVGLIVYLSSSLVRKKEKLESFFRGYLPYFFILGAIFLLVMSEPDLGSALILAILSFVLLYAGGVKVSHLLYTLVLAFIPLYFAVFEVGYRRNRILSFLSPESDPRGMGFQPLHLKISLGCGGFWGMGPGKGQTKLFYLPTPHTDSIFAVVGEELGFIGTTVIVILFAMLAWRGLRIVKRAPDPLGKLLAIGFCSLICIQGIINMGVATVILPTTGTPLPFISYGGSSMLVSLISMGVLLNISRYSRAAP